MALQTPIKKTSLHAPNFAVGRSNTGGYHAENLMPAALELAYILTDLLPCSTCPNACHAARYLVLRCRDPDAEKRQHTVACY
ncbi:hypothetical protein GUJ93_ZPchr0010g7951 [Zizania palustris]|uniref:Uncharacterized protein n=1 Tax=Zizania palustris TaxID=103762 RepID=A0A8J5TIB0_ZIZPA|nr:hypothetical protein GUJ93_ZPchr0010g7951 [Zizania palustris]